MGAAAYDIDDGSTVAAPVLGGVTRGGVAGGFQPDDVRAQVGEQLGGIGHTHATCDFEHPNAGEADLRRGPVDLWRRHIRGCGHDGSRWVLK